MKKMKMGIRIFTTILAVAFLAACGDKEENTTSKGTNSNSDAYVLASWNGSTELAGKVYLQFHADGTLDLYQNIDSATGFVKYTGHYSIDQNILTGNYNSTNGTTIPFASRYIVKTITPQELVLISADESITSEYSGTTIPDYVKEAAPTTTPRSVRAEQQTPFL